MRRPSSQRVLLMELDRVEAQRLADFVVLRFHREHGLRRSVAAITAADHVVRVHRVAFPGDVRAHVIRHDDEPVHVDDLAAVRRVCAGVEDAPGVPGREGAVVLHARLQVHLDRVARGRDEIFVAGLLDAHRPTGLAAQQRGERLYVAHVQLAAEATADIRGFYHADVTLGYLQRERHLLAQAMQVLLRRVDGDLAVDVPVGDAYARLEVTGMDPLRRVDTLEDVVRLRKAFLDIAVAHLRGARDVVLDALVQLRRARLHRLFRVEHRRQVLVFDLYQVERLLGDVVRGRRHRGDRLAGEAHGVAHDLKVVRQALRVGRHEIDRCEFPAGTLGRSQHGLDAGQRLGGARVDADDLRVRERAAQQLPVQHARHAVVDRIILAAGDFVDRVGSGDALADYTHDVTC